MVAKFKFLKRFEAYVDTVRGSGGIFSIRAKRKGLSGVSRVVVSGAEPPERRRISGIFVNNQLNMTILGQFLIGLMKLCDVSKFFRKFLDFSRKCVQNFRRCTCLELGRGDRAPPSEASDFSKNLVEKSMKT